MMADLILFARNVEVHGLVPDAMAIHALYARLLPRAESPT